MADDRIPLPASLDTPEERRSAARQGAAELRRLAEHASRPWRRPLRIAAWIVDTAAKHF